MKLSTFFRNSVAYYKSRKAIYMKSGPGRGKTTTVHACVAHIGNELGMNFGISVLSGPLLNPADTEVHNEFYTNVEAMSVFIDRHDEVLKHPAPPQKVHSRVEEAITEYYGDRCPDTEPGCVICDVWAEYDALTGNSDG